MAWEEEFVASKWRKTGNLAWAVRERRGWIAAMEEEIPLRKDDI